MPANRKFRQDWQGGTRGLVTIEYVGNEFRDLAVLCWDPLRQRPRPAQTTGILGLDQYVAPTAGVRDTC